MAAGMNPHTGGFHGAARLREEGRKVVRGCEGQLGHWEKVQRDYDALQERLHTLPDELSYDVMVPFGPLAFMPGKLVHTNEVTVLLGDNWFAKCSAKQAENLVEHRKKYVKRTLDDLRAVVKSFEDRARFAEGLEEMSGAKGDFVDIREKVNSEETSTKGKRRVAHKPNSRPRVEHVVDLEEDGDGEEHGRMAGWVLSEEELWARLDELESAELLQDQHDRTCDDADGNAEDATSSSSEEEKEGEIGGQENGRSQLERWTSDSHSAQVNGIVGTNEARDEEGDVDGQEDEESAAADENGNVLPTIYFSHTVEPKKVRINTGKNTTLKFSERKEQKEQAKKKKKNGRANGSSLHEHHKITTPADIYRVFVDVVNGEPVPRKSILKSRSRENSVCSDTSESSAAELEERRSAFGRVLSHDEPAHSDTSDGIAEEDSPPGVPQQPSKGFEAFSGTVVEKDPLPLSIPHLTIATPALPTIPERKSEEVAPDASPEPPKRVSKFKASRLQQR
ncbi:unconventional prefoldin RPB5 interactor 1 [Denticeps clupeoides]|uniref:Protein phosphatase 1 regulatory subunit 19 n=1 Tax=Denticeps clupeoides TaxID=299321 RepID=A0AAY4AYA3_9TELE|nr:unconventional prefoldin RPB5 interactor 1 [Denticeps clupeoides]